MSRTAGMIQRKGRWYYNRRYPKPLWPILGATTFRLALNTDSLEEAQRRRPDAERRYWAKVDEARGRQAEATPRPFSEIEVVGIVSRWFHERTRADDAERRAHPAKDIRVRATRIAGATATAEELSDMLGGGDVEASTALADRLLAAEGINADRESPGYRAMLELLTRGDKERWLLENARLRGDFGYRPADPVFAAALQWQPTTAPRRTVADLIKAYRGDKEAGWSLSTMTAYEPVFRLLRDVLGENRDLATVDREAGRELFDTVKALPRGLGKVKELAGLSVPDAVAKARTLGLPLLAAKSINDSYMAFLTSLFGWAVEEQWISSNPVAGLRVVDHVHPADKRDAFTVDQLKSIFGGTPWNPRDDTPGGKPLHFWGPLLALFHGMRRGEIAQLGTADVQVIEDVPVLLIRPGDGRRLKTANARRMMPVHPELVRMGFLGFVEGQRKADHQQLFPGEAANARGQWGDGFGDWFNRLLKARKVDGRRLGLHSFRHGFQDRLREADLHGTAIGQELAGRSKGGDVSNNYGSGFSTAKLAEAIGRVSYPTLDLSHLHVGGNLAG